MIYLVRHGESEWNRAGWVQGQTSHPELTERGREQAALAGERLAAVLRPQANLISSDLVRAEQTAAIIGQRLGLAPVSDPRLREQQLGVLQGLASATAAAALGEVDWSDRNVAIGGGESIGAVYDRMAAFLEPLRELEVDTVVVSHGDAIRLALGWVQGESATEAAWPSIGNGAIFAVDAAGYRELS